MGVARDRGAARSVVAKARRVRRGKVWVVVLGKGKEEERVREWLTTGAKTKSVIGFAVLGRVFWHPWWIITKVSSPRLVGQSALPDPIEGRRICSSRDKLALQ